MLYLVGTANFDANVARRRYNGGEIERLAQGVYCDMEDTADLPEFMKQHAVRIASYLFPNTVLVQSSAFYRGPVPAEGSNRKDAEYMLFIGGTYNRTFKFRLKHLKIVQSDVLQSPALYRFCQEFQDGQEAVYGKIGMLCASEELILLQNMGVRRYHLERFLDDDVADALLAKMVATHGDGLLPVLHRIAEETRLYYPELSRMAEMMATPANRKKAEISYLHDFTLGWSRRPVARYRHNKVEWEFEYEPGWILPLEHERRAEPHEPAFLHNSMPEGHLADLLIAKIRADATRQATMLSLSQRYLGNLAIVSDRAELASVPRDCLLGRLAQNSTGGVFSGRIERIPVYDDAFWFAVNELLVQRTMPRLSGMQAKLPVRLDERGVLAPADTGEFTHILKLPGDAGDPDMIRGAIEWTSMDLARAAGVRTAAHALVELDGGALAYVAERFDIPTGEDDTRMIFAEDFCALRGHGAQAKYIATGDQVAETLLAHSTKKSDDAEELLRLFVTNYLLENADFHLKNLALVKIAEPTLDDYRSVRLAPAFDIINTRFFRHNALNVLEPFEREPMVFTVNGRDADLHVEDFVEFGCKMGIDRSEAHALVVDTAHRIARAAAARAQDLPEILDRYPLQKEFVVQTLERAALCCHELVPEIAPELTRPSGVRHLRAVP